VPQQCQVSQRCFFRNPGNSFRFRNMPSTNSEARRPPIPASTKKWTPCIGTAGRHALERVDGMRRNRWPAWAGSCSLRQIALAARKRPDREFRVLSLRDPFPSWSQPATIYLPSQAHDEVLGTRSSAIRWGSERPQTSPSGPGTLSLDAHCTSSPRTVTSEARLLWLGTGFTGLMLSRRSWFVTGSKNVRWPAPTSSWRIESPQPRSWLTTFLGVPPNRRRWAHCLQERRTQSRLIWHYLATH
jgi:hypothetical protein